MAERKYGVGIQTFEKLLEIGAVYVDKTAHIYRMAQAGNCFFMSRPRRFGKSLLLSTMEAYFQGRKDLFKGLAIEKLEQEWTEYPVLRIDLSKTAYTSKQAFDEVLNSILRDYEAVYGKNEGDTLPGTRFNSLIQRAYKETGKKVVVLIDEYDAPLLDVIDKPELLAEIRDFLRSFYKPLKANDAILKFVFLTGITKFSQLSIFSALNNLRDVSMLDNYATLCGFSEEELFTQMSEDIRLLGEALGMTAEKTKAELKKRYDGYHFSKNCPDMYNPFSLVNVFANHALENYWFQSGTTTWLAKTLYKYDLDPVEMDHYSSKPSVFDTPSERATTPIPVLYQSGYLTIKSYNKRRDTYVLGFPNEEVRISMCETILPYYSGKTEADNVTFLDKLTLAFDDGEIDKAMHLLRSFFSSIPYNAEKQDENHYKTVFYLIFRLAATFGVRTEECTAAGRSDCLVETEDTVYCFEFKFNGSAQDALEQIDSQGYLISYETSGKKLVKIGASFDSQTRTLGEWIIA